MSRDHASAHPPDHPSGHDEGPRSDHTSGAPPSVPSDEPRCEQCEDLEYHLVLCADGCSEASPLYEIVPLLCSCRCTIKLVDEHGERGDAVTGESAVGVCV